jgi:hypothetical protein
VLPANQALQRTGRQQRFVARWPSQRLVAVLPPPLSVGVRRRKPPLRHKELLMNESDNVAERVALSQTEKDAARQFLTHLIATFHARINILLVAESLLLAAMSQVWGSRELGIIMTLCALGLVLTILLWDPLRVLAQRTAAVARLLQKDDLYQAYIKGSSRRLQQTHRLANWVPAVFLFCWSIIAALAVLRALGICKALTSALPVGA